MIAVTSHCAVGVSAMVAASAIITGDRVAKGVMFNLTDLLRINCKVGMIAIKPPSRRRASARERIFICVVVILAITN
jgi:hypothetical protein